MVVTDADVKAVYDRYRYISGGANIVVSPAPAIQSEMQQLAELFIGRNVARGMSAVVTTSHSVYTDAERLGYIAAIETAGVTILQDVCFYLLQRLTDIRRENDWTNLISNSAKLVNTITAHRFNTVLRRTRDCVEIACTGELR